MLYLDTSNTSFLINFTNAHSNLINTNYNISYKIPNQKHITYTKQNNIIHLTPLTNRNKQSEKLTLDVYNTPSASNIINDINTLNKF